MRKMSEDYKYEFPKAALVRDIFTEYTQKKEEKE